VQYLPLTVKFPNVSFKLTSELENTARDWAKVTRQKAVRLAIDVMILCALPRHSRVTFPACSDWLGSLGCTLPDLVG
jgi:hypothetical protein